MQAQTDADSIAQTLNDAGLRARTALAADVVVLELHAGESHVEMYKTVEEHYQEADLEMVSPTKFHVEVDR